jgi:hypothetical protein
LSTQSHPRQHLIQRHDRILATVASEFQQLGFDVIRSGYEAGGRPYDPDLFIKPPDSLGFYLEIKHPDGPNIAIDLDPWLHYRILRDVLVMAVWGDGRCAVIDVDNDRPLFWGAADDDCIPVLAADQLRVLDVPLRPRSRGDTRRSSNKPFVVFKIPRQFDSIREAIAYIIDIKAGGCCVQP